LLGLTEVPDEVTIALANAILMEMQPLAATADSHTLGVRHDTPDTARRSIAL
jgi:hypothetical protein